MTMLRLTDAGRAALADGNNRAVNNVQLRALAIGSGTGPGGAGDDARVALRSQEAREDLTGTAAVSGRLAVRATFNPAGVYSVTEAGIIARIGDTGQEFLLAYWAVPSAANALATTVSGVALIVAGVMDITNASAEVNVNIASDITFGGPGTLVALSDVPGVFSAGRYLRANNTATAGLWSEAPPVVADEDALPQPAAAVNSVFLVEDYNNTGEAVIAHLSGGAWRYVATRTWVAAQIAALVDSAPASLDTLNELAAALEDNADIVAVLRAAIGSRMTQAQVDARIRVIGRDVVLATDIDLTAGARVTQNLSASMDGFRWLAVVAGEDSDDYGTYLRVPRADVTALSGGVTVYAASAGAAGLQMHTVDLGTGIVASLGAGRSVQGASGCALARSGGGMILLVAYEGSNNIAAYPVSTAGVIGAALHSEAISDVHGIGAVTLADGTIRYIAEDGEANWRAGTYSPVTGFTKQNPTSIAGLESVALVGHGGAELLMTVTRGNIFRLYDLEIRADPGPSRSVARGAPQMLGGGVVAYLAGVSVNGQLYALIGNDSGGQTYSVNDSTGALTAVGGVFTTSAFRGFGMEVFSTLAGGIDAGPVRLDRDSANSLGLRSGSSMRIHEVIGVH